MDTRTLGTGGPEVAVICFGAWPIGGAMGEVSEEDAIATVRAAVDVGMTFIDTAEGYRTSEALIGKALDGRRHEAFLATKLSGDHTPEHLSLAIENSLRALRTDYVDLYQLHGPRADPPIGETMERLLRLREAGKIRYIGISNFSAEQTREAVKHGPIHSSQPVYNMLVRGAEEAVLPCCLENGVGVIPHSVLAKGLLTGRYRPGHRFPPDDERNEREAYTGETFRRTLDVAERLGAWATDHGRDLVQLAVAWTLAHPSVTSSIVGAKTPQQVRHIALAADWKLSDEDLAEIDEIQGDLRLPDLS